MSWQVLLTKTALEGLSDSDRDVVSAALFQWVDNGPPRQNRRLIGGAEVFEDELSPGYRLAYFVNEAVPFVAIVRIRKIL